MMVGLRVNNSSCGSLVLRMGRFFESTGVWKPEGRGFSMGVVQPEGITVHLTGQVAWDADSQLVGPGDVRLQTKQCFENIRSLLKEVGGDFSDIVNLTTYFLKLDDLAIIQEIRAEVFAGKSGPASTSVRVAGLGHADFLVELTPIAVIPSERFLEPKG